MKIKSIATILFLVFLLLEPEFTFSQKNNINDFKLEVGKPYSVIDGIGSNYFFIGDKVYALKKLGDGYTFQRFDASTLRQETKKYLRDFPDGYVPEYIKEINDGIFIFYSLWENGDEHLYCREVNLTKGTLQGEAQLLLEVDDRVSGWMANETKRYGVDVDDKFNFIKSDNDSIFLVSYKRLPVNNINSKNYDVIGIVVFDIDFNMLWSKEVRMLHTEKKLEVSDYYVSKDGIVYILTTLFKTRVTDKSIISGKPNFSYEVLRVSSDYEPEIIKISLDDNIISSLTLFPANGKELYAGGYYTNEKNKVEDAKGTFLIRFNIDGSIDYKSVAEFPLNLINRYESKKTIKKNIKKNKDEVTLPNLLTSNIVQEADGSFLLIGEQEYILEYTDKVIEYYDNILVSKFSKLGEPMWTKKLPKKQRSAKYSMGFSFKHYSYNFNHYFLFMDNPKPHNLDNEDEPETYIGEPGSCLSQYTLNTKTGKLGKSLLFYSDKVNKLPIYYFSPWSVVNIDEGIYIFEAYKKNKQDVLIKAIQK